MGFSIRAKDRNSLVPAGMPCLPGCHNRSSNVMPNDAHVEILEGSISRFSFE